MVWSYPMSSYRCTGEKRISRGWGRAENYWVFKVVLWDNESDITEDIAWGKSEWRNAIEYCRPSTVFYHFFVLCFSSSISFFPHFFLNNFYIYVCRDISKCECVSIVLISNNFCYFILNYSFYSFLFLFGFCFLM